MNCGHVNRSLTYIKIFLVDYYYYFPFLKISLENIVIIGLKESPKKIENDQKFENCLYENCQKNDK
jgi:hypothetical protein